MLTKGLKDGSLDKDHQLELALAISKNQLCAYCYLVRKKLDGEVQEVLASGVKKRHYASSLLKEYRNSKIDLPAKVVTRMERLEKFWGFAYWAIRFLLVVGLVVLWIWHMPDWRTALVLTATVAITWTILRVKAWLD
jgi:hypothetical protein